jgi:hypothetical protein
MQTADVNSVRFVTEHTADFVYLNGHTPDPLKKSVGFGPGFVFVAKDAFKFHL